MPPFEHFFALGFGTEIIYSFVIIVCSLMIYFGTKELYELSSYKGIKYFRQAFLFFALAYFVRSFIQFLLVFFGIKEIFELSPALFGAITAFFFIYLSSISIFYLVYSIMWKKWNGNSDRIWLFHVLAIVIAVISAILRTPLVYFGINILLLFFVLVIVLRAYRESKSKTKRHKGHGHNLYAIYMLLIIFWILNIIGVMVPGFFQIFQLFIYLISSGIFLLILYKVLKKASSD